jgi:hypothetical protein
MGAKRREYRISLKPGFEPQMHTDSHRDGGVLKEWAGF